MTRTVFKGGGGTFLQLPVYNDTWSEWKLALLKCGRIENFTDELNNKQNAELDRSKNC